MWRWLVLFVGMLSTALATSAPPARDLHVLILHSYHPGFEWTEGLAEGLQEVLLGAELPVHIQTEFMDTKRLANPEYFEHLRELYAFKYAGAHFDVIVCSDDDAFNFLVRYRDSLFPSVPVVFCGVNYYDPSALQGFSRFTGVVEAFDVADTLTTALDQNPGVKEVVIVNDATTTGIANRKRLDKTLPAFQSRVRFRYLTDVSMDELRRELGGLQTGSLVLLLSFNRDRLEQYFAYVESLQLMAAVCHVPIYGVWEFYLGHGIVGGKLTSGYLHGRAAAQLAVRILRGEPVDSIPVITRSTNRYMFDARELARFRIPLQQVPENSLLINRPSTSYSIPRPLIWLLAIVVGILGCVALILGIDVRWRRHAEHQLTLSEQRYRELANTLPESVFESDAEGRLTFANKAAFEHFGYTAADFKSGLNLLQMVMEEDRERATDRARRVMAGEPLEYAEYKARRKDGSSFPVLIRTSRVMTDGKPSGLRGIIVDISERKRTEEERRQLQAQMQHTQKLESLGVLAGGIAHDFNNLLMGVLGNANLALMDLPKTSPLRPNIENVEAAARRAADLCRQLLAYSGKGRFLIQPVDLSHLVEEMVDLLRVSVSKRTEFKTELGKGLPPIAADQAQIQQVVMNLITNAAEAIGDQDGTITVTTGLLRLTEADQKDLYVSEPLPEGEYLYLTVTDTGCGMDAETQARMFDPFFTTKFTGRGLGLAAVLGIVRGHKGALRVISTPGHGTVFTVYFPVSRALQSLAAAATLDPLAVSPDMDPVRGTVLVADDEPQVLNVAVAILKRAGFSVLTARDGAEAVDRFREHAGAIDLVVLDLTMPRMDGMQALQTLRQIQPNIRVVLSSGYSEQDATGRFPENAWSGFIQKPYLPNELVRQVARLIHVDPGNV